MPSSKEYAKEVREWRKANHMCVRCGKEEAYKNYTCCLQCRMDLREAARLRREKAAQSITDEQRIERNALKREQYASKKQQGICKDCNKPVFRDHAYCYEHYLMHRRAHEKHYAKIRKNYREQGLCPMCGKPPFENHKVCEEHYIMLRNRILKINEQRRIENERKRNEEMAKRRQ